MLIIEVELLGARYAATAHNDRGLAEWPPHPARFYSALVAAMHELQPVDTDERNALLWMERQPAPALDVDLAVDQNLGRRKVHDVFVPVNNVSLIGGDVDIDKPLREARQRMASLAETRETSGELNKAKKDIEKEEKKLAQLLAGLHVIDDAPSKEDLKTAVALLPDRRTRQVRTFPVVMPGRSRFAFVWSDAVPADLRAALERLCARVTRLGHSSSLVRCAIVERAITPTLVPNDDGSYVLRTVGPGQLDRLEKEFAQHQGVENRVLPSRPQRYGPPRAKATEMTRPQSVFSSDWIIFERVGGSRPLSSRATDLTRALRDALIEQYSSPDIPAWLSGHRQDGTPATQPHLAFVALPFIGHEHADASVQGCAVVVPRQLAAKDHASLLRLIALWEKNQAISGTDGTMELAGGTLPTVRVRRVGLSAKVSLLPETWCRPARRFITATPIALDRNPGNLRSNLHGTAHKASIEAQNDIATACERIGLPRPVSVEVSLSPLLAGAQPVHSFLPWPAKPGRTRRVRVHADILFAEIVNGPVILGAGRYFGLGLCRPVG
jgi:CRISPR-associated protein Csb2